MASASLSCGALGTSPPSVSSRTELSADMRWVHLMSVKSNCLNSLHGWILEKLFSSKLVCCILEIIFTLQILKLFLLTLLCRGRRVFPSSVKNENSN